MIPEFNRGAAITIEIIYQGLIPHGEYMNSDVTTPKITVWSPSNKKLVTEATPAKQDVGKYFYNLQTLRTWEAGIYRCEITGVLSGLTGLKMVNGIFRLL